MKLLLHVCCAPCSVASIAALREEGMDITLFWYNPNIHPWTEYKNRRDALSEYAGTLDLPLIMENTYGLREFLAALPGECIRGEAKERRCALCYRRRMEKTAETARAGGFDAFTSTLLISPYQNHSLLAETAEAAALRAGTAFLYRDFRPVFRKGREEARRRGLYMQKYCGCIFSEEERYGSGPFSAEKGAFFQKNACNIGTMPV